MKCSALEQSKSEMLYRTGFVCAVGSFGVGSRQRGFRLLFGGARGWEIDFATDERGCEIDCSFGFKLPDKPEPS